MIALVTAVGLLLLSSLQKEPFLHENPLGPFPASDPISDSASGSLSENSSNTMDGPLSVTLHPSATTLPVGGSFAVTAVVAGGLAPYAYSWSGTPPGCASADTSMLKCVAAQIGSFTVVVTVGDASGQVASGRASVSVLPTLTVALGPAHVAAPIGATVGFIASVAGGLPPYSFEWTGLPPGCASVNSSSLTCSLRQAGSFLVELRVGDSLGEVATSTLNLTIHSGAVAPPFSMPWFGYFAIGAGGGGAGMTIVIWRTRRKARSEA